jgi:hypothetical protein
MDFMSLRTALILALVSSPLLASDVQTLSGKKLTGDIVSLDKQALTLKTADGEVRHPIKDVLLITLGTADQPLPAAYSDLELTDGSVLHCTKLEFREKALEVTAAPDLSLSVPYAAIASLCKDAHDPKNKLEFQQMAAKRGRFDIVAVRSEGRLNVLEGTLGNGVAPDGIEFTVNGSEQKATPRLAKIAGLVFVTKPDPNATPPVCKIMDAGRNALVAAAVDWNSSGLTISTVSGFKVSYPNAAQIVRLDFSQGKLTYLSDLDPSRAETTLSTEDNDKFAQFVRYRRDKNLDNGPIRLDGTTHAKGLTLHAGSALVYELGGEYATLRAILGVDESVQTESRVEVVIEGNGRELFRAALSRRDPPKPLVLDVKGVQQLRIEVRSTALTELGGELSLADAKVSK